MMLSNCGFGENRKDYEHVLWTLMADEQIHTLSNFKGNVDGLGTFLKTEGRDLCITLQLTRF